jgi:Fe-S cluster biogenesis protein NfuA
MSVESEKLRITAEPSMDPNVCKFVVEKPVYPNDHFNCTNEETAKGSPLLEDLFKITGVHQVMVSNDTVTIKKSGETPWQEIGKEIGSVIRRHVLSDKPMFAENLKDRVKTDSNLRERIQKVFDEEINPGIAAHGGHVELVDVQGTSIFLTMSGGCQGCGSAQYTLHQGIEQIVRARVPEVTDIVDVTDHAAGTNPYY